MSSNESQSETNENSKSTSNPRRENFCQESRVKQRMHDFLLANRAAENKNYNEANT